MDDMVNNPVIIIQARMNSERLPGKVMKTINCKPLIGILFDRLKKANLPIILATSVNKENDVLVEYASKHNIECFRGSEENVLERYYEVAKHYKAELIFRLTGDNPLMDPTVLSNALDLYNKINDIRTYISSGLSKTYPLGISCELFSFELLKEAYDNALTSSEKEHVTPYMHQNKPGNINIVPLVGGMNKYHYRLTVDTSEDFELHEILIEKYRADKLTCEEIISLLDNNPELLKINSMINQKSI